MHRHGEFHIPMNAFMPRNQRLEIGRLEAARSQVVVSADALLPAIRQLKETGGHSDVIAALEEAHADMISWEEVLFARKVRAEQDQ